MISWTIKSFDISHLKDHPKNPRKLSKESYEQLKTSIEKFGLIDKPICTKDGLIIGGHQRKNVLKKMGSKKIECYIPDRDLTEKEVDELCIRLNKNVGEWDFDTLANAWEQNDLSEWGFSDHDLQLFLMDDDEKPEKSKKQKALKVCPSCGWEID